MTTISEVARLAGVTPATVSNVLRRRGRVGESTRLRVLAAAKQLEYRPHLNARALVEGKSPILALMVPSIANPFYPQFALAAERAAQAHGRFLIVCNTDNDPNIGNAYLEQIAGTLAEGILVIKANLSIEELKKTERRGAPVVLSMWEKPDSPPELPCIAVDFHEAGEIAARHLLKLGHRHIGVLFAGTDTGFHVERYRGFTKACHEFGLTPSPQYMRYIDDEIKSGYCATLDLLRDHPNLSAIFASNDLPAIGAMNAIADYGLNVPADISVIGITDISWAQDTRPALTTVAVPTIEAARMSVELLLALIERKSPSPIMQLAAKPKLIERASTAPPSAHYRG